MADTTNRSRSLELPEALGPLRDQLLDISKRNRLLNTPVDNERAKRAKQIRIVDADADQIFDVLYRKRRRMHFEPARETDDQLGFDHAGEESMRLAPMAPPSSGVRTQRVETKLQTTMNPDQLNRRLLTLFRDARMLEEEQGASILFLGLGFLRWRDDASTRDFHAPLILLPVDLSRSTGRAQFAVQLREQDLEPNLSLRSLLDNDFAIHLPDLPETDDWRPSDYYRSTEASIAGRPGWVVERDILILGFYSFAKFIMWRDLHDDDLIGRSAVGHELIERLLASGFEPDDVLSRQEENLDVRFSDPRQLGHVLDADSSQTDVIAAARDGRNLVVQGPPGTGKSQTIANIIAVAARDRKTVLFVAEKRAALDVVHDRLEECGLGSLCLELHSRKANRKMALAEIRRTLDEGRPQAVNDADYDELRRLRDELNAYTDRLHRVDAGSGETPYRIIGELAKLRATGCPLPDNDLVVSVASWNREEFRQRLERVRELAELTERYGQERNHVWRGVRRQLTPMDRDRFGLTLDQGVNLLNELSEALDQAAAATSTGSSGVDSLEASVAAVRARLDALHEMPEPVPVLLQSRVLREELTRARAAVRMLSLLRTKRDELLKDVNPDALNEPWGDVVSLLHAHGRSPIRWLNRAYRSALVRLRSAHHQDLPRTTDERIALARRILDLQLERRAFSHQSDFASDAFGRYWLGEDTDWQLLDAAIQWIEAQAKDRVDTLKEEVDRCPDPGRLAQITQYLRSSYSKWRACWQSIVDTLDLCSRDSFNRDAVTDVALPAVRDRLLEWQSDRDALANWYRLNAAARACEEIGLSEFRTRLGDGRLGAAVAEDTLRYAWAEAVWRRLTTNDPELAQLDGDERTAKASAFRRADNRLKEVAAREIALIHNRSLPTGSAGQMGIVRGEVSKKRRHLPLRVLLDKAGDAVTKIKPVVLMSPISVAQFLKPGCLTFDVVVIDEASQVRPADALGAIARARQLIVVGDAKQLPPTSFFDRQVEADDDDTEEADDATIQATQAADMESILTLCTARTVPSTPLRWHYRSQHDSLIAVSDRTFYGDQLIYAPSPERASQDQGLTFTKVDGEYRSSKRNNPREARTVAYEVLQHARRRPDMTLGVATFSIAQRDAILNELEVLRRQHPEIKAFCSEEVAEGTREPFFVKNLESVQGDERDVVFVSVGYGKDKDKGGVLAQRFGPISQEGGERRLNVLFTRAKRHCRVFSSITHGDIRADNAINAGPRVLKTFLQFAETGEMELPVVTGKGAESPFEEAVAATLRSHGYAVDEQIGVDRFRIDLAVRDPEQEGRFLLGIECDGARYHSARWARERDRLRQDVLERRGWSIHRIWSTDWFQKPESETRRVLAAIADARVRIRSEGDDAVSRSCEQQEATRGKRIVVPRERSAPRSGPQSEPYREASFKLVDRRTGEKVLSPRSVVGDLHSASAELLERCLIKVVSVEGPVHIDEVAHRLSRLWGNGRTGARIRDRVAQAANKAVGRGHISRSGEFVQSLPGREVVVRDRSEVKSQSLRKVEMLPPQEVDQAIMLVVASSVSLTVGDCAVQVARMLGFKSTSGDLRRVVERRAARLASEGRLEADGEEVRVGVTAEPPCPAGCGPLSPAGGGRWECLACGRALGRVALHEHLSNLVADGRGSRKRRPQGATAASDGASMSR